MNAVGIDVSKGKSMVCVMRPFGEVVLEPFEVLHTAQNLHDLAEKLKALDGETRVVLEATGNYHKPVAFVLHDAGLFVSVVNPVLIHDYDNNSLRRVKTDRKDAVKIANYTLDKWTRLRQYRRSLRSAAWMDFPACDGVIPSIAAISFTFIPSI